MQNHFSRLAPVAAALFAGFLFISWGGTAGWRTLQNGVLPYPGFQAFEKAPAFKAPAKTASVRLAPAQKVELSRRLGAAVSDPSSINKADLAAVNKAWGKDAAAMLSILKDSSR